MIAQQGRVVRIEGDDALVRIGGTSGCPACDAGNGCGAGIFGRMLRKRPVTIHTPNVIGAAVGEAVQLGIAERQFLVLVFRLYAMPILAGLLGAAFGFAASLRMGLEGLVSDLLCLLAALIGAGLIVAWNRRGLREFPMDSAVHLLHDKGAAAGQNCGAQGTPGSVASRSIQG